MTVANRREREQQMRRQLIMNAAQRLFEKKGYESTTVDEIAAEAELGKGTIYSYFKSKDEIYIAILEQGLEILKERVFQVVDGQLSAGETLYALYDTFIQYHRERRDFAETLFVQVDEQIFLRLGDLVRGLKNKSSEWVELVSGVLQKGIDAGEFIPCDIDRMAKTIIGLILGLILQYEMGRIDEDLENFQTTLFQLVLHGIKQQ
jgi:TetR/AcrR family transcriptional regulator